MPFLPSWTVPSRRDPAELGRLALPLPFALPFGLVCGPAEAGEAGLDGFRDDDDLATMPCAGLDECTRAAMSEMSQVARGTVRVPDPHHGQAIASMDDLQGRRYDGTTTSGQNVLREGRSPRPDMCCQGNW